MYTNGVLPFGRTPHLLLNFPTEDTDVFVVAEVHPIRMTNHDGGYSIQEYREPSIPGSALRETRRQSQQFHDRLFCSSNQREHFIYATEGYDRFVSVRLGRNVKRSWPNRFCSKGTSGQSSKGFTLSDYGPLCDDQIDHLVTSKRSWTTRETCPYTTRKLLQLLICGKRSTELTLNRFGLKMPKARCSMRKPYPLSRD